MTAGATLPLIFKFTLPLLLGNLLQQTYSLVDAAIVGKFLGVNPLAAVGASSSVVFLILGFCTGCCCGFGIPVAQKFGARDYSTMRRYVYSGLKLTAWMSIALAIVTCLLCEAILRMMSTPENIFHDAYLYLLITFVGIPATFYYNLLSSVIRALGDSKTPFWFLLFSTILNVVLDLFCILVLKWGVAGAAIATVFSQALSAYLCYVYMMRKFDILQGRTEEHAMSRKHVATLLKIGVPMGLQFQSRRLAASCCRARTTRWALRAWRRLRQPCASRCFSFAHVKVLESPWQHLQAKIMVQASPNAFGKA